MNLKQIEEEALHLPESDRAELVHRYPIEKKPDIRRIRMNRFPFTVLFREYFGTIQVLAVAHHRRRPLYWLNRL